MKKIIAVLLSLALLLCCAAGLAEETKKTVFGTISVNGEFTLKGILPEGYKIVPFELSEDAILSTIVPEDASLPYMVLSIAFDETYSDVDRMNDLDDEALAILEKTFTDTDPLANITYDETAYGTRLMVCRTLSDNYDYLDILSIYKGYFVEFVMKPGSEAAEQRLTDEQVALCHEFLSELDFVPGKEEPDKSIEGKTFDALIETFDAEAKTIEVTLLTPVEMTAWDVLSIREGDNIRIGNELVEIGTLEYEGDDTVIINDEYNIRKNEDGLFNPYSYEFPIMMKTQTLTVAVPDEMVFEDQIDPESGEILEESKKLTAAEFFAALEAAEGEGVVTFDSQNVKVSFDEAGQLVKVLRYYTPWQ